MLLVLVEWYIGKSTVEDAERRAPRTKEQKAVNSLVKQRYL